ncbi:MAG: GTP-binding protein, partial [Rhodobacteraceae bacterium]
LDLAQAEALADLIDAETNEQRKQALGQLGGRLSEAAEGLRSRLISVLTPLEADIDFPDEGDVPAAVAARAGPAITKLKDALTAFLANSRRARTIRKGINIAIIGPPNVGKSSLVNVLAGADVAIVSDVAGTTRDVVEARLDLGGILATLSDTAGLRDETNDAIEAEGMARARSRAKQADLRVAALDPRVEFVSRETLDLLRPGDFLVWTHADLNPAIPHGVAPDGVAAVSLSPLTGLGVDEFIAALTAAVSAQGNFNGPALTRARHVRAVEDAVAALTRAEEKIETAPELAAEDARLAARALGSITGAVGVEDVLDEIFSSFCIGK